MAPTSPSSQLCKVMGSLRSCDVHSLKRGVLEKFYAYSPDNAITASISYKRYSVHRVLRFSVG
jgi:hypothetical protein